MAKNFLIDMIEQEYGVKHVGYYDLPDGREGIEVFYQENPNTELGHSHYMGFFQRNNRAYVTNALSIVDAEFPALQLDDGTFLVSRYRHNFASNGKDFIDGGLDYTRSNRSVNAYMRVVNGKEVFYANTPTHRDKVGADRPQELQGVQRVPPQDDGQS